MLYEPNGTIANPLNIFYGNKIFRFTRSSPGLQGEGADTCKQSAIYNINKTIKNIKIITLDVEIIDIFCSACDILRLKCGLYVIVGYAGQINVYDPIARKIIMSKEYNIRDSVSRIKNHEEHPNKFYIFSYYWIHCCELIFNTNSELSENVVIDVNLNPECVENATKC